MREGRKTRWIALSTLAVLVLGAALWWGLRPNSDPTTDLVEPSNSVRFLRIEKVDAHVHASPDRWPELRAIMDAQGIAVALNASGGTPSGGLERSAQVARESGGRLRPYCTLDFGRFDAPGWEAYVERTLDACVDLGAVGLKIYKALGLGYTRADGTLLEVDAAELDIVFETAGALRLPVLIHSGDPQAFFEPPGPSNERDAELEAHPSWSFHGRRPNGRPWPSWEEVFAQYERRVARHPNTTFVGAHFGNAPEAPDRVADMLARHPNLVVETGARIPEIGRHDPVRMRRFFERFQDRILLGTDLQLASGGLVLGSVGKELDPPSRVPAFFRAHWRYFETTDRDFAHPTPIQGDWTIDGLGLPRPILEKLYRTNAIRVFDLQL